MDILKMSKNEKRDIKFSEKTILLVNAVNTKKIRQKMAA
jgi:hypothetical protein